VTDDADLAALVAPVVRRQFAIEIGASARRLPEENAAQMWVYRLEDPTGGPSR
jgi:hypothetical protein